MDLRRSINTKVWSDDWFEGLNSDQKLLWLYLLTNPQTNMLGIYEVSIKRMVFDTGLSEDSVNDALQRFGNDKKCFHWDGWIVLPNWLRNQAMNTNMKISAKTLYENLNSTLKAKVEECGLLPFNILSNDSESFETLPKKEKEKEKENRKLKEENKLENNIYMDDEN